jgi:hypothetical protein
MKINREGKTHDKMAEEITSVVSAGGDYGWIGGWGSTGERGDWTQLGLVMHDRPVPFLGAAFPRTLNLLSAIIGVKVAAFVRLRSNSFLPTHSHPELRSEGLLQMHLTLDAAETSNYAYLNVQGEFYRHDIGTGVVFDGSQPHFGVNASNVDRTILYIEFRPRYVCDSGTCSSVERTDL